jgi:predicted nucleic acid-binding Zn ribbon protein
MLIFFPLIKCDDSKCSRIAKQTTTKNKRKRKKNMLFSFYIFDHAEIV